MLQHYLLQMTYKHITNYSVKVYFGSCHYDTTQLSNQQPDKKHL